MTEKSNALALAQLLMLHADAIENDSIKNMVIDSATELAVLREDIEALRRDAERYRWMKREVKRIPPAWDLVGWDAAIDAAMQEVPR